MGLSFREPSDTTTVFPTRNSEPALSPSSIRKSVREVPSSSVFFPSFSRALPVDTRRSRPRPRSVEVSPVFRNPMRRDRNSLRRWFQPRSGKHSQGSGRTQARFHRLRHHLRKAQEVRQAKVQALHRKARSQEPRQAPILRSFFRNIVSPIVSVGRPFFQRVDSRAVLF